MALLNKTAADLRLALKNKAVVAINLSGPNAFALVLGPKEIEAWKVTL